MCVIVFFVCAGKRKACGSQRLRRIRHAQRPFFKMAAFPSLPLPLSLPYCGHYIRVAVTVTLMEVVGGLTANYSLVYGLLLPLSHSLEAHKTIVKQKYYSMLRFALCVSKLMQEPSPLSLPLSLPSFTLRKMKFSPRRVAALSRLLAKTCVCPAAWIS